MFKICSPRPKVSMSPFPVCIWRANMLSVGTPRVNAQIRRYRPLALMLVVLRLASWPRAAKLGGLVAATKVFLTSSPVALIFTINPCKGSALQNRHKNVRKLPL